MWNDSDMYFRIVEIERNNREVDQLSRRNLTDITKMVIIGRHAVRDQNDPIPKTAEKIAQEQGIFFSLVMWKKATLAL